MNIFSESLLKIKYSFQESRSAGNYIQKLGRRNDYIIKIVYSSQSAKWNVNFFQNSHIVDCTINNCWVNCWINPRISVKVAGWSFLRYIFTNVDWEGIAWFQNQIQILFSRKKRRMKWYTKAAEGVYHAHIG